MCWKCTPARKWRSGTTLGRMSTEPPHVVGASYTPTLYGVLGRSAGIGHSEPRSWCARSYNTHRSARVLLGAPGTLGEGTSCV
jgi:hypothetical protein